MAYDFTVPDELDDVLDEEDPVEAAKLYAGLFHATDVGSKFSERHLDLDDVESMSYALASALHGLGGVSDRSMAVYKALTAVANSMAAYATSPRYVLELHRASLDILNSVAANAEMMAEGDEGGGPGAYAASACYADAAELVRAAAVAADVARRPGGRLERLVGQSLDVPPCCGSTRAALLAWARGE